MKKFLLMFAVAALAAQNVSAQTVQESKNFDNWYIGINGGVNIPGNDIKFDNMNYDAGLRIGRWFTPVVGLAAEGQAYFGNKCGFENIKTTVKATNVSILGTLNFCNWFGGYPGTPRAFEVIALAGLGWWHDYGVISSSNVMTSKLALDFTLNFGSDKQWQLYLEPNIVYNIADYGSPVEYNINRSLIGANIGLNYKFGNSNGTHNFKIAELRDQSEIDALNAKINELRSDVDAKNGQINAAQQTISDLKKKLAECEARPKEVEKKTETVLQPIVIFRQGKSVIDAAQYANVEMVAKYMKNHPEAKVLVKGYASPEGSTELNQRLSEARAKAVVDALVNRYKIAKDRISFKGFGETSELSEENDFNRVAMFIDTTK